MAGKTHRRRDIINAHGRYGQKIIDANKSTGLDNLALACALVEQESAFQNIFGCDYGSRSSAPFCHQAVTKERVQQLLAQSLNNGVGLTQITDRSLVQQAEAMGGAHLVKNQLTVGFAYLKHLIDTYGYSGAWHFNGSPAYQAQLDAKYRAWQSRLR